MSNGSNKPSMTALLGGVVVGVVTFVLANYVAGRAIVPTPETVANPQHGLSAIVYPVTEAVGDVPVGGPYQTLCQTCHQAEGQGIPGAFPPLAGSEWVIGDPETPIRIAILGLTGAIEVKGATYNSTMPPPAGITDEQVVEVVNYIRTNFGNQASEVDLELVKQVRASLAGRTNSWTAAELTALRAQPDAADAGVGVGADAPEPATAQPAEPAPKAAAVKEAAE